jgi:MFS family permease
MTLGAFITSASAGNFIHYSFSEDKLLIWEGLITNIIGRKTALWIGCILCLIGDIIMMTTSNIGALYFGRFIMGVSNALFSVFGLLYIQVYLLSIVIRAFHS